jgi:hypothetical protein
MPQRVENGTDSAGFEALRETLGTHQRVLMEKEVCIERDSSQAAELLFEGKQVQAISLLSADLFCLANNPERYNALLIITAAKVNSFISRQELPSNAARLELRDYNRKTGTWNRVEIKAGMAPTYRLVQPGCTLEKMVRDYMSADEPDPTDEQVAQVIKDVIKENRDFQGIADISDQDSIRVGQFLSIVSFAWEFGTYR